MNANVVAWGIFKWAVVPGALFASGYYLFGPQIGAIPAFDQMASRLVPMTSSSASAAEEPAAAETPAEELPVVEVEVTVTKKD